MEVFAEFAFRYAINRLACVQKTNTFNTLTLWVVARDEVTTRRLTVTILHGTSLRGEQSSTSAVAEVNRHTQRGSQSVLAYAALSEAMKENVPHMALGSE